MTAEVAHDGQNYATSNFVARGIDQAHATGRREMMVAEITQRATETLQSPSRADEERDQWAQTDSSAPMLPDETQAPDPRDWLAAIIDGSEDAIVSKNLHGTIQTWNPGATRLFGYSADEVVGKSIMILIPPDRRDEEPMILAQIHEGKRVEHFETKRLRKDGTLVDISLTISPIRNKNGVIVGASKIARDITERLEAQEQQQLLMGEMRHRVKNLFALANAIVSISRNSSASEHEVIANVQGRMLSLARAHDLIMSDRMNGPGSGANVALLALVQTILEPYAADERITIRGDDCELDGKAATHFALLLHELATNAAKYGSLSVRDGRIDVITKREKDTLLLLWRETGGPEPSPGPTTGFGSRLEKGVARALNAEIERDWQPTGLTISVVIPHAAAEI